MRVGAIAGVLAVLICGIGFGQGLEDLIIDNQTVSLLGDHEYDEVRIINGGKLRISKPNGNPDVIGMVHLTCSSLVISASSMIDGWDLGGFPAPGQGFPPDPNRGGNGGRHGGHGGAPRTALQGPTYGTLRDLDILFGSPATEGSTIVTQLGRFIMGGFPGHGGAAIKIRANQVHIEGSIVMDGGAGEAAPTCPPRDYCPEGPTAGGGGAGGGVLILTNNLTIGPNATITTNGGDGGDASDSLYGGFGGGGGRIKIFYETGSINSTAIISANPGVSVRERWVPEPCTECAPAEPGTIWVRQVSSIDDLINPSADFNNDGIVNYLDANILMSQWYNAEPTVTPWMTRTPNPTWTEEPPIPTSLPTLTPRPTGTWTPTKSPTPDATLTPTPEITATPTWTP